MDMLVEKGGGGLHCSSDDANKTSKAKQRHVQINNSFEHKSRLKKHYEPLEIQVTFNNNDNNNENENKNNENNKNNNNTSKNENKAKNYNNNHGASLRNGVGDNGKGKESSKNSMNGLAKDDYICTPSPDLDLLDTLVTNKRSETDDVANLLARIHRKDDDTVQLLTSRVQLLSDELDKRNSIIFSLLKTLDFVINQDISTVRTNKQLNQYLNNNKEVYIKDVISSSRWKDDTSDANRISEDDWQMDLFQYMKNHINNIDTILLPATEANGDADTDDDDSEDFKIINGNGCTGNDNPDAEHGSCCDKHKLNTLPPPKIPPIDTEPPSPLDDVIVDDPEWPPDTIALVGDNLLHGIDEKRLGGKNWNVKVRIFPESHVSDFFHYVQPIMHKRPTHLVLHVGTNDAPHFAARDIYDGIMSLKNYVEKHVPTCKVIVSKPIIRMDNCQANLTILKVNQLLDSSKILTIDNGNFGLNHLSKKGPNLNPKGTARLAMNIISQMKSMLNEPTGHAQAADGVTSPRSARSDPSVTSREEGSPRDGETLSAAELFFRASKLNPAAKSFNPLPSDLEEEK